MPVQYCLLVSMVRVLQGVVTNQTEQKVMEDFWKIESGLFGAPLMVLESPWEPYKALKALKLRRLLLEVKLT